MISPIGAPKPKFLQGLPVTSTPQAPKKVTLTYEEKLKGNKNRDVQASPILRQVSARARLIALIFEGN